MRGLERVLRKGAKLADSDFFKNGGAVWKSYSLDFRLPFNEIAYGFSDRL